MDRRRFLQHAAVGSAVVIGGRALAQEVAAVKLATVAPDGTPWAEQLKEMRARFDGAAQKKLRLKAFLGGAMGDEVTTVLETKRGGIHMWGGSTGALASVVPELALFELPYLFRNYAEADLVIDKVLSEDMQKVIEARGLKLLFWAENGYRSFGTTFGPVTKPEHIKGKKMRSQESDAHLDMYRSLGASPVPIAVTEVLSSLQTGVVDGFDNTPLYTFAASWHKGIKHYSLTEAIYQPGAVVANKAWYDSIPPELQKALAPDPQVEAEKGRKGVRELAPLLVENFKNDKIAVYTLTDAEKATFAKLCEPVHERWAASKGKTAQAMLKKAKSALADLRKRG